MLHKPAQAHGPAECRGVRETQDFREDIYSPPQSLLQQFFFGSYQPVLRERRINSSRDQPPREIRAAPRHPRLVLAHQAGIADNVDGKDGGEAAGGGHELGLPPTAFS